jgi:predicted Zn-dependent protease
MNKGKSKATLYKIRDQYHEVLGSATEEELLKRISRGKFTGEEEISSDPFEDWQKISAHPVFYDAFLRRLYDLEYKTPGDPDSAPPPDEKSESSGPHEKNHPDKATRQAEPGKTEHVGAKEGEVDLLATSQLKDPFGKDVGATIHQSLINELFPESGNHLRGAPEAGADVENAPSPGTDIVAVEPNGEPLPAERAPELALKLDNELLENEVAPERPAKNNRRVFLWGGLVVVLLLVLLQMGKSSQVTAPPDDINSSQVARPDSEVMADSVAKDERVKTLVEEGDRLFENDVYLFYSGAFDLYREALGYDEGNTLLLGRLTLAAARMLNGSPDKNGLVETIHKYIQKGRQTDPQFSQFYRAEALIALSNGKIDEAKKLINDAEESDPSSNENSMIEAEVLKAQGDLKNASIILDGLLKVNQVNARAHFDQSQILLAENNFERARVEALATIKINPLHPGAYFLLAEADTSLNLGSEAFGAFESSARLASLNDKKSASDVFLRLGNFSILIGDKNAALKNFQMSYWANPGNPNLADKIKNLDIDAEKLKALALDSLYSPSYFQDQGDNLVQQKKYREAILFYQAAYVVKPKDGIPLVKLGELYEKIAASYDDFRTVTGFYQRAIQRDPSLTTAYIKLGLLETDQYNFDRGYKLLTQAVALSPDDAAPYVALGKHFFKRQDYNESLNQFLKASHLSPSDSEIVYYAGLLRLLYKKDSVKDSISYFYRAYTLNPQNYDALVEWLKLKVVDFEKNFAIKFVRNLMQQDPGNANLFWAMGEIYAENKEYRRSVDFYHRALDIDNRMSKVRMSLGKSLEAIGELEKAVAEYRLASLLDRKNSDGFYHAADLLFQIRHFSQSEEVIKVLINDCPNYPGAHEYLSKIYQVKNQKDAAVQEMKKEVANNPQNPKFQIELSELYMDYQMWDDAIAQLSEVANLPAVSRAPEFLYDKIRAYLLLARSYRAQGKLESAEGAIRLALDIDNNDPELHRELGYVYHDMQREKESIDAFQFYLSREPAARDAAQIKTMIQQMMIEE